MLLFSKKEVLNLLAAFNSRQLKVGRRRLAAFHHHFIGDFLPVIQAAQTGGQHFSLGDSIYVSGGAFFTVGAGAVTPQTAAARFLVVVIAGTGLGFIAVVIGYLPVLYQLFARREAHIIQLDARAGSPPSAVTLLARHGEGGALHSVDALLRSWETWA